jgi:hypothetical protein
VFGIGNGQVSNIATRFKIPSVDPVLNMTNVSANIHPTRIQSNVHFTMKETFIARTKVSSFSGHMGQCI